MKKGKWAAYVLAGILFVSYIGILWWSREPEVPELYRLYYIDQELVEWPGEEGLLYQPGKWEYLGSGYSQEQSSKREGRGWSHREQNGRWTEGSHSFLWYQIPEREQTVPFVFHCELSDCITPGVVRIYVGDQLVSEINPQEESEWSIAIPSGLVNDQGFLVIRLDVEEPVVPSSTEDHRELGVMVSRIMLETDGESKDV